LIPVPAHWPNIFKRALYLQQITQFIQTRGLVCCAKFCTAKSRAVCWATSLVPRRVANEFSLKVASCDSKIRRTTSPDTEAHSMRRYPSLKPGIWGAVIGAVAISVIGFSSLGWTLGSTAERMAKDRAQTAVVGVLAPICVEKFQRQADAATKLIEFNKVSSSWDRRSIIEKGGWATVPGTDAPNSAVVTACAERLGGLL
jgi:hypothetical protein